MSSHHPQQHQHQDETAAAAPSIAQGSSSPAPDNGAHSTITGAEVPAHKKARRNHRAGKKSKKNKKGDEGQGGPGEAARPSQSGQRPGFYRQYQSGNGNLSTESLSSEALLDHRNQEPMRQRRDSRAAQSTFASFMSSGTTPRRRYSRAHARGDSDDEDKPTNSKTPLLGSAPGYKKSGLGGSSYGGLKSSASSVSTRRRHHSRRQSNSAGQDYDVNNPPSVPPSPVLGASDKGFGDVLAEEAFASKSPVNRRGDEGFMIDIERGDNVDRLGSSPAAARPSPLEYRRHTIAGAEGDVCFPQEGMSALGEEEDYDRDEQRDSERASRRRSRRQWPDLVELDDWAREEKESRSEGVQARKIREPKFVGGRLRPIKHAWHREPEDAPYRFTYFNEHFDETIHSRTISELVQPGQSFKDLFLPDPLELTDYSSEEEEDDDLTSVRVRDPSELSPGTRSGAETRQSSIPEARALHSPRAGPSSSKQNSGERTPVHSGEEQTQTATAGHTMADTRQANDKPPTLHGRPKRYGERPTFWLDVLCPTEAEMKVISRAFGIHMLTSEDILMQETHEKVELFRHYYFINYRTFEQDVNSEDYLEPVNMYVVVFREGVISFHFSLSPHPANVRRRVRQLKDYLQLNPDWLAYALIDDVTDAYAPLIQAIEEEVDEIDDAILELHSGQHQGDEDKVMKGSLHQKTKINEKVSSDCDSITTTTKKQSGGDMLRRVGRCRKKVMGMYRLLGNKADVIKGFAKRCNEHWDIAPRSDIGMFLGDIQDHILTMTGNLNHYETLLSRAHSNYLAQINIRMNERQELTSDILGKLTVLGTIVLPMNVITGMWGMNILVPGQGTDSLHWFWSITAGLAVFGLACYFIAKKVYGIV